MARWAVIDSLYCPEQWFASHLDSYGHFLSEAGETVVRACLNYHWSSMMLEEEHPREPFYSFDGLPRDLDIAFFLDGYARALEVRAERRIAQVAAVCSPMPWEVRKADGSPAYDLVISSIPAMVEQARAAGCRAEYQPLAFDLRARACMMGVKRDLDCIFIGTTGPNHQRRTKLLEDLKDVVTVLPPVFGREYMRTLARARCVISPHAEWAHGAVNNMRIFEAAGLDCEVVTDGDALGLTSSPWWVSPGGDSSKAWRDAITYAIDYGADAPPSEVLRAHTYECADRVPRLIDLARSL